MRCRDDRWFDALRLACCYLLFGWSVVHGAQQYSIVDLGDLGANWARAWAINDAGQVAGDGLSPSVGGVRAALWQAGTATDLGTLGGPQSSALAINNAGLVCGWAHTTAGYAVPTVWTGTSATPLLTLGGSSGQAGAINDAGTAVGYSDLGNGSGYHATLWSGGTITDLGTLGGGYSRAYDINNSGITVGWAENASGKRRATLWTGTEIVDLGGLSGGSWTTAYAANDAGQIVLSGIPQGLIQNRAAFWDGKLSSPVLDLGTLGGKESWAYGLNDAGWVVGAAGLLSGTYAAFVWDGSEMANLGTLGGLYSSAFGINDQGVIVGWAMDALNRTRAVQWVPVPEPKPLLLGWVGACLLGFWTRCRRQPR